MFYIKILGFNSQCLTLIFFLDSLYNCFLKTKSFLNFEKQFCIYFNYVSLLSKIIFFINIDLIYLKLSNYLFDNITVRLQIQS